MDPHPSPLVDAVVRLISKRWIRSVKLRRIRYRQVAKYVILRWQYYVLLRRSWRYSLFITWIPKFYHHQVHTGKVLAHFLGTRRQQPNFPPKLLPGLTKFFRQILDSERIFGTVWGSENDVQPIILSCMSRSLWKFLREICDQMKIETTLRVEICRLANLWESTIINLGCLMVHFSKCYGALVMGLYDQRVPIYYDGMIDNWIALLSKFRLTHEDWKTPLGGDSIEVMSAITAKFIHVTSINKREMKCAMCFNHRLITEFEIREDRWSLTCRRCAVKCQDVRMLNPLEPMSRDLSHITLFELLNQMMNTSIEVACQPDK